MSHRVAVLIEGQTEQNFINQVISPEYWQHNIFFQPILVTTSLSGGRHRKGGYITYDSARQQWHNLLAQPQFSLVTTNV